jgi:hypothetical protein
MVDSSPGAELGPQAAADPQPQVLVYPTGHKPIVRVLIDGRWHTGVVRERHGTAYRVLLDPGTGPVIRTYSWPSPELHHVFTPPP